MAEQLVRRLPLSLESQQLIFCQLLKEGREAVLVLTQSTKNSLRLT